MSQEVLNVSPEVISYVLVMVDVCIYCVFTPGVN